MWRVWLCVLALVLACQPTQETLVHRVLVQQVEHPTTLVIDSTVAATGERQIQAAPYVMGGMIIRYGFIQPVYRDSVLAKTFNDSIPQLEAGGCITDWSASVQSYPLNKGPRIYLRTDSVYWIARLGPNQSELASRTNGKAIKCEHGQPEWHVHPPQTCSNPQIPASCFHGGWEAFQCSPSLNDLAALQQREAPFDIVRCGPNQWVFYFFNGNWNNYVRVPALKATPDSGGKK